MKKNVIVTLASNDHYRSLLVHTLPYMKRYADSIKADLITVGTQDETLRVPHYQKFKIISDALEKYERVAWIDCDVLINKLSPSIFAEVPDDSLGIFNEAPWVGERHEQDRKDWMNATGFEIPQGTYYNTGVMVISRIHKDLFKIPDVQINHYGEQTFLNQRIIESKMKIHALSHHWNRMTCTFQWMGEEPFCSWFIHFAGDPNIQNGPFIKRTIEEWEAKKWTGEKRVHIISNNGMGNQIASIPAIEYLFRLHPDYKFSIQTAFPEVYAHLKKDMEIFSYGQNVPYRFALAKSTAFPGVIQDVMSHPLDYHAGALLQRQLPRDAKRITTPLKDCGTKFPSNTVVLHAGKSGWASKEMPEELWQQIVDGLKKEGFKVATIGAKFFEKKTKDDPQARPWGAFDLKNVDFDFTDKPYDEVCDVIRQCAYLLSNDSMPVHAAGAFDKWIGLITIAKRPELIFPYRHGGQDYKTQSWIGVPLWEVTKEIAVFNPSTGFNWGDMHKGMQWPDPRKVVEDITSVLKLKPSELNAEEKIALAEIEREELCG